MGKSHQVLKMSNRSDMEEELSTLGKIMSQKGHWIGQKQWIYCYKQIEELRGLIRRRKAELRAVCGHQKPTPQAGRLSES